MPVPMYLCALYSQSLTMAAGGNSQTRLYFGAILLIPSALFSLTRDTDNSCHQTPDHHSPGCARRINQARNDSPVLGYKPRLRHGEAPYPQRNQVQKIPNCWQTPPGSHWRLARCQGSALRTARAESENKRSPFYLNCCSSKKHFSNRLRPRFKSPKLECMFPESHLTFCFRMQCQVPSFEVNGTDLAVDKIPDETKIVEM